MSLFHAFQTPRLFPCDLKWAGHRASMGSCLDSVHLPGPWIQGFRPLVPSLVPLKKYNTQVILCGHEHANRDLVFEGVPGVTGRSNLRVRAPVGGFNLVEVKEGKLTVSEWATGQQTKPAWTSVVLQRHDYASETNRYPRPDFSVNSRYPGVKSLWT